MNKIINRSEQKIENTWDLSLIFKNDKEYSKEVDNVSKLIDKLVEYENSFLKSANDLYLCLELDTLINRKLENIMTYVHRKYDEDLSNSIYQELIGKFTNLLDKYSTNSSYIVPKLLEKDYDYIDKFIKEKSELEKYELLLKRIYRYKEHTLSTNEEMILSELSSSLNATDRVASIIRNSEIQFGTIKDSENNEIIVNNENFVLLLKNSDERVRHDAFMSLYNAYSKYKDTLSECMNGFVSVNAKIAKLKHYDSARNHALFSNRVDDKIYDNLVNTVNDRLDVLHKYYALRKKVFNSDINIYDTYVSLVENVQKEYTIDEAKDLCKKVLNIFNEDYIEKVNELYENRYIDIYPNESKRGGAYSSGSFDTAPYILLNYQNTFHDVSTLIHETGHSIHTMYAKEDNDYLYYSYKIFVAEVASTVNELLLHYYMLENTNDVNEKKYYINEMMDMIKATLFRQTMFAEFEQFMYSEYEKGNVLTSKMLSDKYLEINKKYFGDNVIVNDEIKYEWLRIPHFYYNFYVYQYATGISAACYIVNRIRNNEENAVSDYINFLKCGDMLDPVESLKVANVDMSDNKIVNGAIDMFDSLIEKFESLI